MRVVHRSARRPLQCPPSSQCPRGVTRPDIDARESGRCLNVFRWAPAILIATAQRSTARVTPVASGRGSCPRCLRVQPLCLHLRSPCVTEGFLSAITRPGAQQRLSRSVRVEETGEALGLLWPRLIGVGDYPVHIEGTAQRSAVSPNLPWPGAVCLMLPVDL